MSINRFHRLAKNLASLSCVLMLAACSDHVEKAPVAPPAKQAPGDIVLSADSPKKAYIKTTALSLSSKPLSEPLVGKISLDESKTSRISSPVPGRVVKEPLALGVRITAGAPLLELDSPDTAAAEADYAKAQADLNLAQRTFEREQELYAGKAIPRKDLEQAQDDLSQARSEAQRAKDRLTNLHLDVYQNDGRFVLRSPISGEILERHVNMGMEVRPDLDTPLYVIADTRHLSLLLEVFEVNLAKIHKGQQVRVSVPAYPRRFFTGTVNYIGQELDETTRTVLVRCQLPNPDGALLPGMYATVELQSEAQDQAIVVPLTAVYTEDEADFAFVEVESNHYQRRKVQLGLRLKDRAVVESGLNPGELLVSEGALMLRTEEAIEESSE